MGRFDFFQAKCSYTQMRKICFKKITIIMIMMIIIMMIIIIIMVLMIMIIMMIMIIYYSWKLSFWQIISWSTSITTSSPWWRRGDRMLGPPPEWASSSWGKMAATASRTSWREKRTGYLYWRQGTRTASSYQHGVASERWSISIFGMIAREITQVGE